MSAQGVLNDDYGASLPDMDATLFHTYIPEVDPYSEATKYYRPQLSQRRRGLDWWVADDLIDPLSSVAQTLKISTEAARLRLYGSTKDYRGGIALEYATSLKSGWNIAAKGDLRMGSDVNIEGVFREDLRAELSLSRAFSDDHHLSFSLNAPFLTRGLQSDASQEAITLTGDNLYNPSWGLYDGEVRNSRVSRYMIPELTTRYQLPIGDATIASLTMVSEYGRRSISRLGWYDGYNPTPDYYRKLPSYVEAGDLHNDVEQLWRDNDLSYTQIAWDDLIAVNQLSPNGEAHYIVEDQVESLANTDLKLLLSSDVGDGVNLIYGLRGYYESSRNFKQLDDLLGGEYLYDHDLFIGDYAHLGNDMQNDLRNPDRKVVVGDRFGYDYTINTLSAAAVMGVEYRQGGFSIVARGEFGERSLQRIGHYEKERFAGELSYGESESISMADNMVDLRVGYSPSGRHHLWLRGLQRDLPMEADDLFLQVQSANRAVDNPSPRSVSSINLGYRYQSPNFSLDIEAYTLLSRDETQVWSYYDDLSYTYSNVVVSDISTRSIGVDIVGSYSISRRLKWDFAIAIGDYTYDRTPTVKLYSDVDMSLFSTSEARAVNGCKVGNAPQYLATSSLTFFVDYGLILSLDGSFGGGRYIAPSFVRRSDRVVLSSSSPEMANSIVAQESMSAVIDITPSVVKVFYLRSNRQLSLNFRVNNLLGVSDNIEYGREGNRIYRTSGGSDTGSRYIEPSSYIYGQPRTFYLSCGYRF